MKKREIMPFGLRMQPELRKKAEEEARQNRHSLNTEVEMLIEDGLKWRAEKQSQAAA